MTRFIFSIFFFPIFISANGQMSLDISAINLRDLKNKSVSITPDEKNAVILFLGTDCPITQKYVARLRDIVAEYGSIAEFYGVFPSQFSIKEIKEFKKEYKIEFILLSDNKLELAKHLGATVTPEVFLIDKNLKLQYQGAIDNWFYELGKYRLTTTEQYLIDALVALGKGEPPVITKTEAIGCFIQMPREMMDHQNHPK